MRLDLTFFFLLLLRLAVANVVEITSVNFDYLLRDADDPRPFLIFLYSPTCPHCKALKPVWEDVCTVAEKEQLFRVGVLDCMAQSHLCERLGETKVPSVYVFFDDGRKMLKYTGEKDSEEMSEFAARAHKVYNGDAVNVPIEGPGKPSFSLRAVAKAVAAEIITLIHFSPIGCCALIVAGFVMGVLFDAFVLKVVDEEETVDPGDKDNNRSDEEESPPVESKKTR
ncbi:conserved hypothetical protein [Perkinsus marinus ATCC 50983]|uniref:Thioredoxin domain-containing protein n=1 Tax=Perkinsus marinus (strain ATCC 50983 / TXsc) TaxID=423536 RepID=C5LTQ6_PERM5|nr:conserved hypothetical protein [Perkinsus marinus ATCC 50983]EEQ99868.1 conserved hypothetical protein [Perkinsus marinus ATCC 50983]|eukprot:XP_002767151.1 conserved hypothetical protein [Perkinsus marinus ATCC 50983]